MHVVLDQKWHTLNSSTALHHPISVSKILPSRVLMFLFPHGKNLKCCGLDKQLRLGNIYIYILPSCFLVFYKAGVEEKEQQKVFQWRNVDNNTPNFSSIMCFPITVICMNCSYFILSLTSADCCLSRFPPSCFLPYYSLWTKYEQKKERQTEREVIKAA